MIPSVRFIDSEGLHQSRLDDRNQEPRTHETVIDQIVERVTSIYLVDKEPLPNVVKTFRFVDD